MLHSLIVMKRDHTNSMGLNIVNSMYHSLNIDSICKYQDLNSYESAIPTNCPEYLNIILVNVRSLRKNYGNLISLLHSLPTFPDILCVSETWLKPNATPLYEIEGYKSKYTHRPEGYGGVAIYINNIITSVLLSDLCLCPENVELCTVMISVGSPSYVVCSLYYPHSKHNKVNEFNIFMDNLISQSIFINNKVLSGDFNINLPEHNTHPPTHSFLSTMQSFTYFAVISRPTRFPDDNSTATPSLLDHIWINFTVPSSSGILLSPLSDNLPVFLILPSFEKLSKSHKLTFRIRYQENRSKFKTKLSEVNWISLLSHQDTDLNCNLFLDIVYSIYCSSFPKATKFISTKRQKNTWITQGILKSIKRKFELYKAHKIGMITFDVYK